MPTSVIAAIAGAWASSAATAFVVSEGFAVAGSFMAVAAGALAGGLTSASVSAAFSDSPDQPQFSQELRANMITVRQPIAPWQYIYGRARVGGTLTFAHESADENLHLVITLAGHVSQEIEAIQFNDEVIPLDTNGDATGRYAGYVRIKKSLGAEAGQPFADLVTESEGKWTDAHRQTGHTKIYVRLTFSPDLFPSGIPNITVIVKGRLVKDSRTGATVWTDNPSLCISDFMCDTVAGLGSVYASEIDATQLTAAANIDDEMVALSASTPTTTFTADATTNVITLAAGSKKLSVGAGVRVASSVTLPAGLSAATTYYAIVADGSAINLATSLVNARAGTAIDITDAGTGTHTMTYYNEPRYTLNGSVLVNVEPRQTIGRLLSANAGDARYIGGVWRIHPAAYVAPTITLTEDDCRAAPRISPRLSAAELSNAVKGIYISEDNLWQASDFPPITNATYLSEDNSERSWRELDLPFTKSDSTAQRIAKIELERMRQQISVDWKGKISCYRLQTGDTVRITFALLGWTTKIFEVTQAALVLDDSGLALGCDLQLRETASTVFDWSSGEETVVDLAPDTDLPDPFYSPAPTGLAVSATVFDQRGLVATFSWTAPTSLYNDSYAVRYRVAAGTWIDMPNTEATTVEIVGLDHNVTYEFFVASVNQLGVKGTAATLSQLIAYPTLPGPASVTIWVASDGNGNASRMRVKAELSSVWAYVPDGIQVNVAIFDEPNELTIGTGGTGTDLTVVAAHVLASGSGYTALAGSTAAQLVVTTPTVPLPTSINFAGMFWAQVGASQWRKCTSADDTTLYFADPFDITPGIGDTVTWAELSWFDDRGPDTPSDFEANNRLAILDNGTHYEVIRWSSITETAGVFHLTCQRAQEGTSAITADGLKLRYYPAPGPGTRIIDVPKSAFIGDPTTSVTGEVDILVPVRAGQAISVSANAYRNSAGGSIRSHIVPAVYGGDL